MTVSKYNYKVLYAQIISNIYLSIFLYQYLFQHSVSCDDFFFLEKIIISNIFHDKHYALFPCTRLWSLKCWVILDRLLGLLPQTKRMKLDFQVALQQPKNKKEAIHLLFLFS